MKRQETRDQAIDRLMDEMPKAWRSNWCEGGPCACGGCANVSGGLTQLGFTKAEWEHWKSRRDA